MRSAIVFRRIDHDVKVLLRFRNLIFPLQIDFGSREEEKKDPPSGRRPIALSIFELVCEDR